MAKPDYYSSLEKDYVRAQFDTPLVQYMRGKKGEALNYFGLPGEDATDVVSWQESLGFVSAVERKEALLPRIEKLFATQLPKLRLDLHWGDIDTVIINDQGTTRNIGNQPHRPRVAKAYADDIPEWRWNFDVVNLDYFGSFLPLADKGTARRRADALKVLFEKSHQDSWQNWLLLVTTNARFAGKDDEAMMREFLEGSKGDCSAETKGMLDFLLDPSHPAEMQPALLIHGSAANLLAVAASNAGCKALPRGTVIYSGSKKNKMIHMAFEFQPETMALFAPLSRHTLLKCPLLSPITDDPFRFDLLDLQVPGVGAEEVRTALDFLADADLKRLVTSATPAA